MNDFVIPNLAGRRQPLAPVNAERARFGSGVFTKTAMTQFWGDTAGVWAPKMPTVRSWPQAFEETFLEFVEDLAFYFGLPAMGHYGLGKLFARRGGVSSEAWQEVGAHTRELEAKLGRAIPKSLVAAKAGALAGMLALAGGFEYLIQPVRNMITARVFGVKNFTAVAGLESARNFTAQDEQDPIEKGHRRLRQVGLTTAGLFVAALALPTLVKRSGAIEAGVRKLLRYVDFGGHFHPDSGKLENVFDITKPLLAALVTTGVISYLDAARDSLERKETALRLGIVAPYLVFGQELIANAAAWFAQRRPLPGSADGARIGDRVAYLNKSWSQMLRDAVTPTHFLNLNMVRSGEEIAQQLERLQASPKTALTPTQVDAVQRGFQRIAPNKYMFSALVMSIGLNLSAYAVTRMRFNRRQQQNASVSRTFPPAWSLGASATVPYYGLRRANTFSQAFGAASG
ncbi:MAG: hypothetical protein IPK79_03400 [Vampirovibrionales bacterium]|nr:hypothetical protein [Vampirovibrionales bacterium]